jgi:hypothetical protein
VVEGYETLKRLATSARHLVPGHDPLVLQRYPAAKAGLEAGWRGSTPIRTTDIRVDFGNPASRHMHNRPILAQFLPVLVFMYVRLAHTEEREDWATVHSRIAFWHEI